MNGHISCPISAAKDAILHQLTEQYGNARLLWDVPGAEDTGIRFIQCWCVREGMLTLTVSRIDEVTDYSWLPVPAHLGERIYADELRNDVAQSISEIQKVWRL